MKYAQIINRIIAADDLHWDAQQGRFASLSQKEVHQISVTCIERGITDHGEIAKVIQWCGFLRIGVLLRDAFMSGRVRITGFSDGEPCFSPLEDAP